MKVNTVGSRPLKFLDLNLNKKTALHRRRGQRTRAITNRNGDVDGEEDQ